MNTYKLDKVCTDIYSGGTPSTKNPEYWNGNLKWLSSGETSADFITDTIQHITEEGVANSSTRLAKQGSVVMACAGQGKTRGQVSYLLSDMYINQSVIVISTNKEVLNSLYLFYNLKNRYDELRGSSDASSTRGSITTKVLKTLPIDLPNIKQQEGIANTLKVYDDLIEKNNRKIEILQEMAEELYKEWFVRFRFPGYKTTKFQDGIPEGWEVKKASDIFDITIGRTPSRANFSYFSNCRESNYSWISISDMRNNMFISETKEYLTQEAINSCNMPMVAPNTVLLSFKLTVGQVAITTEETSTNEAIAHFNTQNNRLREYTYLYLQNFNYNELGNTSAIGNAINSTIVKNMKFVLPAEDILNEFNNKVGSIFDGILLLTKENNNLKTQRDLLLPRLMSGKLEVKVS